MKNIAIIIILFSLTTSCTEKQKDSPSDSYEVIDEFLRFNYSDAGIVVSELMSVKKAISTVEAPAPPPARGEISYNFGMFDYLVSENLLDSIDAKHMYNQIDTLKTYSLDSSKIYKQTIKDSDLKDIFDKNGIDKGYEILQKKYKANSYISFSTPIMSKDKHKMIISVSLHCGGLCGGGMTYLLEKKNNKWRIIYSQRDWES